MKAVLIRRSKRILPDGSILEIVIWRVPRPVPGSQHSYKYRLYFGRDGVRLIGYDNERGKGDHLHFYGEERRYQFVSLDALVDDFLVQVDEESSR